MSRIDSVSKGGHPTNLGYATGWDGLALDPDSIEAITLAVYLLDPENEANETVVTGFEAVEVALESVVAVPVTGDPRWPYDGDDGDLGWNFAHRIEAPSPFQLIGRRYRARYTFATDADLPIMATFDYVVR